ncbi:hypothetical protein ACFY1P_20635 [Streptomyces sp. NPDC001407]|uniref:hypothetical protein n=1 Tax=Streptomyces sp. NPDC001407 TaxID=3364573 RepID=UPI00367FDB16
MRRVLLDKAVVVGDYLEVAAERMTPDRRRRGEEYARVERVEHIARPAFLDPSSRHVGTRQAAHRGVVAVLCQGMPGAVLLDGGDHHVETAVESARRAWDLQNPTWPARQEALFTGGRIPQGQHADRTRLETDNEDDDHDDGPDRRPGVVPTGRRRAAAFSKPATAVMAGDYVQIHTVRFPAQDMGVDEGFHRVEWARHLPPEHAAGLLTDPAWTAGTVTLLCVHGLPGTLVLPPIDVRVLVQPNAERVAEDRSDWWHEGPFHELTGMHAPDTDSLRHQDAALRPTPPDDEAALYPSRFTDPLQRALHLEGVTAVRPVAASGLPWPHFLFKCPHGGRAKDLQRTYPETSGSRQAAHAELFAALRPEEFAACPYHQADDWKAIAQAVLAHAEAEQAGDEDGAEELYAMEHLSERDRAWAQAMVADLIWWDEGQRQLTNGQHRLCALRAAGVNTVPVYGRHLPGQPPTDTTEPKSHARQAIAAFWTSHLTALWGPGFRARRLGPVFARYRVLRRLLPASDRP